MASKPNNTGDAIKNVGPALDAADLGVDQSYVPEGYETQQAFLDYAVKLYDADVRYDRNNRDWALEDLKFAAGDQWDDAVKNDRLRKLRPCLTINVLPQFIGQVVGDRRMNKVSIKVRPFRSGTKEVADIRSGLIKSIEMYSRAERAYDAACEDQVACGIGNLRADMEYAANDVFDQDIRIKHIPNPLAVVWDRMSVDPTARDAKHCFVIDNIPKEVFEAQYPNAQVPSGGSLGLTDDVLRSTTWVEGDMIRITEFWELVERPAVLALLNNGDVVDITAEGSEEQYAGQFFVDPATGKPKVRKSMRTYARMHLITSFAVLSECYEIPLTRLPIVKVEGRTIRVGEDRVRFGLTRFAKDSQRLKNYWRSKAAESIALAPQAQWIADSGAVEGREKEFRENASSGDPLLVYNKNTEKPDRVDPPAIPAALINEANMNQQDIKDTTGLHDASLGIASNEVSGKAINARKAEGDVATVTYHDNLNQSILELGDICNQMIPLCYDTVRTVRVIGEDDKHKLVTINDVSDPASVNITEGKYDVVLDTGPSFATQRMEAQEALMAILQTSPDLMQVIGDKVIENMDIPGSTEIAARMKRVVPKEVLTEEEQAELAGSQPQQGPSEEEMMAQQMQQAQLQEAAAQLQHAEAMRQQELRENEARVRKAEAEAEIAESNVRKAAADAEAAEAKAAKALVEADVAPLEADQRLTHAEDTHNQRLQQGEDQRISALDKHERGESRVDEAHQQKLSHADRAAQERSEQSRARAAQQGQKENDDD